MTDRPILFSGSMVRAILDGRKSQTRRVLKPQPIIQPLCSEELEDIELRGWVAIPSDDDFAVIKKTPYAVGDRLYVRENHFAFGHWITTDELTKTGKLKRKFVRDYSVPVLYENPTCKLCDRNVDNVKGWYFRPGIHHERCDSRLTLPVTDVRVQRLQEISETDAMAEGCLGYVSDCGDFADTPCDDFRVLWDSLNADCGFGWDVNPWVSANTFTVHKCNIDRMGLAA